MQREGSWLAAAEMARHLGRSESVIRSWRDRYRDLVPTSLDARGRVLYPLALFEEIQELQRQGLTTREVRAELVRRHSEEIANGTPTRADFESGVLERLDRLVELVERIASALDRGDRQ